MSGKVISEATQIGEIQARDAFTDLIMDATIAVDKLEIDRISKIPEVTQAMTQVTAPAGPKYGKTPETSGDWRAKVPEIRKMQWKQKPIIDYIAESNKEAVLEAVTNKFAPLSPAWRAVLFGRNRENMTYAKEARALQLSYLSPSDINTAKEKGQSLWPDATNKWRFVFVQISINLDPFVNQVMQEARQAYEGGKMVDSGEGQMQWASTLVGLDAVLRELDPFSGAKMSTTKVGSWDVADEAGYDIHIRESILDRIQEALSSALEIADISGVDIDARGVVTFSATRITDDETEQDQIAGEMEPEAQPEAAAGAEADTYDARSPETKAREERENRERKERESNELGDDF